jgi:HSP20 family molecular chaperone IbpA
VPLEIAWSAFYNGDGGSGRTASPRLNITENDKAFEVQADMPGVKKEDVKVAIENQRVPAWRTAS